MKTPASFRITCLFVCTFAGVQAAAAQQSAGISLAVPPSSVVAEDTLQALQPTDSDSSMLQPVLVRVRPAGVAGTRRALESLSEFGSALDTVPRRRAVAYSEWYSRRLTIHRYGSYTMLPLFVTQFVLGSRLLNQKEDLYATPARRTTPVDKGLRSTHAVVAGTVGALFVVNTTTGVWNLIESRHTTEGRLRRTIHALTMLTADAGFVYTGVLGSRATDNGPPEARKHRNTALTSFGIATAGAALMWFDRNE